MNTRIIFGLFAALGFLRSNATAATLYTIKDLGVAGRSAIAVTLDSAGAIFLSTAGELLPGDVVVEGLTFSVSPDNTSQEIGAGDGISTIIYGANDDQHGVGTNIDGQNHNHATLFDGVDFLDISPPGTSGSVARAINNAGGIVGFATYSGVTNAFYRRNDASFVQLETLDGQSSEATDINDNDVIVGVSQSQSSGGSTAVAWTGQDIIVLGTLGGSTSGANAVNNATLIVGASQLPNGEQHAAIFGLDGSIQDIGPVGRNSGATDVNNVGEIVGVLEKSNDVFEAAIFDGAGGATSLLEQVQGSTGWERLISADSINDNGQIVGIGLLNGELHGYLLSPVPEPGAVTLIALGVVPLVCRRRFSQ